MLRRNTLRCPLSTSLSLSTAFSPASPLHTKLGGHWLSTHLPLLPSHLKICCNPTSTTTALGRSPSKRSLMTSSLNKMTWLVPKYKKLSLGLSASFLAPLASLSLPQLISHCPFHPSGSKSDGPFPGCMGSHSWSSHSVCAPPGGPIYSQGSPGCCMWQVSRLLFYFASWILHLFTWSVHIATKKTVTSL